MTSESVDAVLPARAATAERRSDDVRSWLIREMAGRTGLAAEQIDTSAAFVDYGIPSKEAAALSGLLETWLGRPVSPTAFWEYPSIDLLAEHLSGNDPKPERAPSLNREAAREPLALIGIGCRFPGAPSPPAFWRLLADGRDAISEVPQDRWDVDRLYDPNPATPGTVNTRWGGFVERIDGFDAPFFGITPREASRMDPQQRLLLEVAWEALEDAGQPSERVAGSKTGVFVGISTNDYGRRQFADRARIDAYAGTGNALSIAANRISYQLDLLGPSVAIDTACSSSLVAVHLACRSLWSGEATLALAGGTNLILAPDITINFTKAGVMAPDGRCKTFDARANGYVRGEGAALVVLKPLAQALADGDEIYAVILGSAVNSDGRTNGLMAPSRQAQEAVLRDAYAGAGISPGHVQYVEAHGTGTLLGDPIEAKALGSVLAAGRPPHDRCAIGSVKTNIGHLEAAAGVAGLVKVALALKHGAIPPSLHFETPNPHIPFDDLPLRVQRTLEAWPAGGSRRIAGVSSFGFGGTNAHVVLAEAPAPRPAERETRHASGTHLLTLSARSAAALQSAVRTFRDFLAGGEAPGAALRDICYSAAVRRSHHEYRLAVPARTREELVERLESCLAEEAHRSVARGRAAPGKRRRVIFVFPGQGSQWRGMGKQLLEDEPVFRAALEACDSELRAHVDWSLVEELATAAETGRENDIDVVQPTLFGIQVALAALWQSWGIEPAGVVGHSMGEVAAAYVAGALTLQDAARVICRRSRLLKTVSGRGAMAVVELPLDAAARAAESCGAHVSVAVESSPTSTVLSGDAEALKALAGRLERQEVFCRLVNVDVASHSSQMDPLLDELRALLCDVRPRLAAIPFHSTVSGRAGNGVELSADYWARNLREPVRFSSVVRRLLAEGCGELLEVSAHPILVGAIRDNIRAAAADAVALGSLQRGEDERGALLGSLGALYTLGYPVRWERLMQGGGKPVALPSYAWQRERCWFEADDAEPSPEPAAQSAAGPTAGRHPLLGLRVDTAHEPSTRLWEVDLSQRSHPYLRDHLVRDRVVLPGAAYVEMALAAAAEVLGAGCTLADVEFTAALFLDPAHAACRLQLVLEESAGAQSAFRIYGRAPGGAAQSAWTLHASGKIRRGAAAGDAAPHAVDVAALQAAGVEEIGAERYYAGLRESGLHYGPCFRGIERVWRTPAAALSLIRVPAAVAADAERYIVHPAVLDAAFQGVGATLPQDSAGGEQYLPVRVGTLRVHGRPGGQLWSIASHAGAADGAGRVTRDVLLLDETGAVVVEARALELQRAGAAARAAAVDGWFYERRWQPQARSSAAQPIPSSRPRHWIVLADRGGVARRLRELVERRGDSCVLVRPGKAYRGAGESALEIDPAEPAHARRLLDDARGPGGAACDGIVHLWNLDSADGAELDLDGLEAAQLLGCASVLHCVQALVSVPTPAAPRLFLITRRAASVDGDTAVSVAQSPVDGLARTIAHEHPVLRCTRVDLGGGDSAELESLNRELAGAEDGEDQVALRGEARYVARLVRVAAEPAARPAPRVFRLEVPEPGVIDQLTAVPLARRPPRAGEIEIEVAAAGVNFMDVMQTLGLVPSAELPIRPGAECCGRIAAVGDGVDGFRVGDQVVAIARGAFASFVTAAAELVAHKPERTSAEEAATLPVAFLTACYALRHAARLRAGERVLIHAAAGGVGLAAVQIARWKKAEIFATAGSPEKRQYLRSLGLEHVFDSRSLAFGDEISERTRGEGVDVVLNSLSGEFADRSLALLRGGGRFLEIGKRDIHENRPLRLRPFVKGLGFFAIDLQQLCAERPRFVGQMLRRLMRRVEDRVFEPLPLCTFAMAEAAAAVRFMAQAKHLGKIVLVPASADPKASSADSAAPLRSDATYLITGGLGGLGLEVARWMAQQGAGHLALVGRRAASAAAEDALAEIRRAGARVSVFEADVALAGDVAKVLDAIAAAPAPLRGIVHAAGVLDDALLVQLDRERLAAVARPKVAGAWNLHTATADLPLDFFVLFSSAAAVIGSPGQANYAAANAFLDALARHRRAAGRPALAIDWGPWGGVGLAAQQGRADRLAVAGVGTIAPAEGVAAFGRLLQSSRAQVAVMPIDWARLDARLRALPLLAQLAQSAGGAAAPSAKHAAGSAARDALRRAAPGERGALLRRFLQEQLARVTGLRVSSIDLNRPLNALGVDSLMALELKNRIERELEVALPIAALLQAPDAGQLAERLAEGFAGDAAEPVVDEPRAAALPPIVPDPAARHLPFPLNDIQGAYWVGRSASLELGGVGAHFYLEFERTELDVERLAAGWRRLIERHEMLRAVVGADGRQQILTAVPRYEVETLDVRGAPAEQARAQVEALRERLAHRVYDASRWPLFAVCVTRLAEKRVRVHVSIDLLMADVWSLFILFREWGWLYAEPERELAPLALSFRDYVLAEAALQGTPRYARARAYWTERLPKLRPGPELPLAKLPAAVAEPRFVRRRGRVEAGPWSQVKARARQAGLTPSVVLCTAFAEVLAAWSKAAQFTLNVTLFHRLPLHPEINAVVGDFTSTVLLAVEGGGTASFVERARRLQQQLWEDLEHRYVSGVQVLRDLARLGGGGPRLGMPVVFTSTLGQEDTDAVTEWLGELVHGVSQTPQVWLDHQVGEERGALAFNWDAVEALFPDGLLAAMFAAYCGRLEQLAADAALWDAPTPALVPAAERQLFDTLNATAAAMPDVTLPALVAAQVAQRPEQLAVLAPARALRYSELGAASAAVASWLLRHGAQPNRLVAVVMDKGWEQIVAVLGVLQAGAAYLPIEADVPAERLALLLEQGDATLVLTQSWLEESLAWPKGRTLLAVDRLDPAEPGAAAPRAAPRGDDLAYVIFTSGSTGVPKGVMLTHRAVVNTLLDVNRRFAVGPADRVLALSALSFDLSVYDIFGTLAAGGTIVLAAAQARRDPAHWLERLAAARVTIWNSVPALLQLLVETAEVSHAQLSDSLRLVLLSGDWIPVSLPDRIRALAPAAEVISLGGATEAAIWSITYPIREVDPAWPSIPYGRPLANQTWHVLHDDGTPCPVWVPGELYIGGAGLAQGYWHDAERTAARFVAHPRTGERLYRTGDWGRYRPDGTLEFLGREDSQVKVHGYRIELGEIEAALARQPGVERAVAVAHGERTGEKRLAAFVVARAPAPDAAALRAALQATLPAYMLPATIEIVAALPLTANGKVDRSALPLAAAKPRAAAQPLAAPRVPPPSAERASVADRVERLVAAALKIDRVDRQADLFALGLTSIDMMRLANELERTFGFRPKIGDLFKLTDVAAVASYYERLLEARRGEPGAGQGPLLGDHEQRDAFKKEQRRLRPLAGPLPVLRLPRAAVAAPHDRRSRRTFAAEQVALADLAAWLECLAQSREEQGPKHRYGSAGGLYPVQAYLHARPGRIGGLGAGTYYYHPAEHALLPLTPDVDLDRGVHAVVNRPVYDQAAFSLFLVAQMSAIEPVYGEKGRDFALLEAGLVTQLLEETAARHGIGLCQIGLADFDAVRGRFLLEQSHVFLHTMLGGRVAPDAPAWEEGVL